jgi:ribulose-phosphate 3-epimerase
MNEIVRKPDKQVILSPSVICADWNNPALFGNIKSLGVDCLHIDIVDGKFSPHIPLSFRDLARIANKTGKLDMKLDFHIMALDNEKYVKKVMEFVPYQICFHIETCLHADRLLRQIKASGIRCGIAVNPATPLTVLEYLRGYCDFVLLMLINPGYADDKDESIVPYAFRKIRDCRKFLDDTGRHIDIELDGRVSFDNAAELIEAGGDILVAGHSSLFSPTASIKDNFQRFKTEAGDK